MRYRALATFASLSLLLSGCVSSGKYETALAEAETMRQSLGSAQDEIDRNQQTIKQAEQALKEARRKILAAEEELKRNQQLLETTNEELEIAKSEVSAVQSDVAELEAKKRALQQALADSRTQLGTLRNIEAETKHRNAIYAQFVERLKTMIDGGQLTVNIEHGRIVINLPNNVLFRSGSASLNSAGSEALAQVAEILSQVSDRHFQIEGHTDNQPINSARFPSNWELSTSRSLAVVHLLAGLGVPAENLSAAGFGEFQPRAENETEEGRQLNRRIEIIMLPNLDILSNELPSVTSK